MSHTDNQDRLLCALDDAVEHLHWEFDADAYQGASTCGFAHIAIPDGRCSFVQTLRSLANSDATPNVYVDRHDELRIDVGGVEARCASGHRNWRLSITNVSDLAIGASYQRMDLQERLHRLLLERLQLEWGYLDDARVRSRMD